MSLLVDIASQALDPAYAEAARRRAEVPEAGESRDGRARRQLTVLTGVLAATLLVVIAGVQAHARAPEAARSRQQLLDQVDSRGRSVTALQQRLDALRTRTAMLRADALATDAAGARLARRLSAEELVVGTLAATGPGLRVVLDDGPSGDGDNRVVDRDLQAVVNALWAAGAEAVAVGRQRLTAQSAIRQAGSAVLVNFQPVLPPYRIVAIGDPIGLETSFATSRAAARMRGLSQLYGIGFHYDRTEDADVPSAPGLTLRYARPIARTGAEAR